MFPAAPGEELGAAFISPLMPRHFLPLLLTITLLLRVGAGAQVVINEILYHPVEHPHFDANGNQTYADTGLPSDTSSDVHEFVELQNAGAAPVDQIGRAHV